MNPKVKWHLTMVIKPLGYLLMPLFLIAWPLSRVTKIKKWMYPLWLLMDDTIRVNGKLAEDYRIYIEGFKYAWVGDLSWHLFRNTLWNFKLLFSVDSGIPVSHGNQNIKITKIVKDQLFRNDHKLVLDGPYEASAALKYVGKPGDDPWQVNRGDVISYKYSTLGEAEYYYETASGFKGWRKTSCKLVKPWFLLGLAYRWRTVYKGSNTYRWAFKNKYQKKKPWSYETD